MRSTRYCDRLARSRQDVLPGVVIVEKRRGSLDELGLNNRQGQSNLSCPLCTMEGHGLVHLERGKRGRITPKVIHDRVELDLALTPSRKAS